jgi:Uma2 family endonuclease
MASAITIPVEQYLRTSYEPACEYIDGELRPKAMGTKKHGKLQGRIFRALEQRGLEVATELTCRLSSTRFLIPDVAAAHQIEDPYPSEPVQLCVEILSPEDRLSAALAKCEFYHDWGVPDGWIFNPQTQTAWEYHKSGQLQTRTVSDTIQAGEIAIPMHEIMAGL